MADKEYDVSHEVQRLFKIKQKQREAAKNYFRCIIDNPHRKPGGLFDPVLFRFTTLLQYRIEHVKPKGKTLMYILGLTVMPVAVIYSAISYSINTSEKMFRNGKVAYKDRVNKLVY